MNIALIASNYISRYAPSKKKIHEYLIRKKFSGDMDLFLQSIGYDEDIMYGLWMRTFLSQKIGKYAIKRKLIKKWFSPKKIDSVLEGFTDELHDWENYAWEIELLRDTLIRKGKSLRVIQMTLIEKYPYFRDQITTSTEGLSNKKWLTDAISRIETKYNLTDSKEKQKFFANLQRKWFWFHEIQDFLKEREKWLDC